MTLVTGGAGFIGSHLVARLVAAGRPVRVLDDYSSGKAANLAGLPVETLTAGVGDDAAVAAAVAGVDTVFHLGAMVSVPQSVAEPFRCHEANATGTLRLALAAKAAGVRRIVFAGSSSAYGDAPAGPIDERRPPVAASPYAASKLAAEQYLRCVAAVGGAEAVILRFFNVYGPRQDPGSPYSGVISRFVTALLAGRRPQVFGDGLQSRDFVFVTDVVDALLAAAERPAAAGGVYNIGRGEAVTLRELLAELNAALGTDLEPEHHPPRAGDIRESRADIAAARRDLGFAPAVGLRQGLEAAAAHYRAGGNAGGG